nr:synaptojanin-2-binding protein isoform X1 [Anser cygnoides]
MCSAQRALVTCGFPGFAFRLFFWILMEPQVLILNCALIQLLVPARGLGFNIVGGTDQQYVSNDSSIYVSRIKKDGAAYLDGRLQEGDKILAINGRDLKDLRHMDAVELFRNAGYDVSLKIQRRLQPQNGPVGHRGDGDSGGLPLAAVLVPGLALAAAAVWILLRYRQRM